VALLVEAIKEQQKQIDALQQKVNELTKEISKK
jgi:cell division protein FtsL